MLLGQLQLNRVWTKFNAFFLFLFVFKKKFHCFCTLSLLGLNLLCILYYAAVVAVVVVVYYIVPGAMKEHFFV